MIFTFLSLYSYAKRVNYVVYNFASDLRMTLWNKEIKIELLKEFDRGIKNLKGMEDYYISKFHTLWQ